MKIPEWWPILIPVAISAPFVALAAWIFLSPVPQWSKTGATEDAFAADRYECSLVAEREVKAPEVVGGTGVVALIPGVGPLIAATNQPRASIEAPRRRLIHICLEAKGWRIR